MKKILILTVFTATLFAVNTYANNYAVSANEEKLTTIEYSAPEWNEYDITFESEDNWTSSEGNFTIKNNDTTVSLVATVTVDREACFMYNLSIPSNGSHIFKVYVDDKEVRSINNYQASKRHVYGIPRYFEYLKSGTHKIKWEINMNKNYTYGISSVGCVACDPISVSLLEPGSLGTEVLYQTDHLKNVKKLKVSGKMNDDDWEKVKMMSSLIEIDLSEAVTDAIPKDQFSITNTEFLNKIMLPEGLEAIGNNAFYGSNIESIIFPSTLTTIGSSAFWRSNIREVVLPDNFKNLGAEAFSGNYHLANVYLGKSIEVIPESAFENCYYAEFTIPNSITTIEKNAFYKCQTFNENIPEKVKTIGQSAFEGNTSLENVVLPECLENMDRRAFAGCTKLKYLELPTSFYDTKKTFSEYSYNFFVGCSAIETIRLNSPNVVERPTTLGLTLDNITLYVPSFLVNAYKLDSYWYNAKEIIGFDTDEIEEWTVNKPLVLNAHDRLAGNPNIIINGDNTRLPSVKINGDASQTFNNITLGYNYKSYINYPGQILANCDNVSVNGDVTTQLYTTAKYWYFFSLPYDIKVSDITHDVEGTQFAIRYYDGANRAANGKTGSWKNYASDAVIPAGAGFIFQTNQSTVNYFKAIDNEAKQNVVANKEFKTKLDVNAAVVDADKGWNLIGNPYACYYNNHILNFVAPITVWNASSKTYSAYSLADDDYAIRPNEAFFVQCPSDEINTISFPLQGRQLNATIETQNAVKNRAAENQARQIVNIMVATGEITDQARIVVNEEATMAYDMESDASKFISPDALCAQIYSLDDDNQKYAINERPLDNGIIRLGFQANQAGHFKFSTKRCDFQSAMLTDNATGISTDITSSDYEFDADAGVDEERFTITLAGLTTDITAIDNAKPAIFAVDGAIAVRNVTGNAAIYSIDGRLVASQSLNAGSNIIDLPRGTYIVNIGGHSTKVLVK